MGSHVFRPLWVAIAIIILIFVARYFMVPSDFGIQERGFTYGFHRKSDESEWASIKAKYKGRDYCKSCHADKYRSIMNSKHRIIQCENCHGPALNHPVNPPKLVIDRKRALCLRCHTYLPYPGSQRSRIEGINPAKHNPGISCVECHNPHKPDLELAK